MTRYSDPQLRPAGVYDPFPVHRLAPGVIERGTDALARALLELSSGATVAATGTPSPETAPGSVGAATVRSTSRALVIDGYVGVLWEELRASLDQALRAEGVNATWLSVGSAVKPEGEIDELLAPYLGGNDPVFGKRYPGQLSDLFDAGKLAELSPASDGLTVLYGCGAALAGWNDAPLVYVDLPKDAIQHRAKDGLITNLGRSAPEDMKQMYKRYYFVDWLILNRHKQELLPRVDLMVDGLDAADPTFTTGENLCAALLQLSRNHLRVRPWFTPGAWGGQWLKEVIPQLPRNVPNYAWSFELIVPENGLAFESLASGAADGPSGTAGSGAAASNTSSGAPVTNRLEVSFDCLMFQAGEAVLGDHFARFGTDFPIRFDYLDTLEGGNLSVQVHPQPEYIAEQFGEPFTQDETYYLVDCTPDAKVYLGFQEGVQATEFGEQLERSAREGTPIEVERYVRSMPAEKHGLYLIPHGTVHCSGTGNLVLEVSATPYIFTFKLYDWLRLDLDGKPRPLNVERGMANLDFSRQGEVVDRELVSRPRVLSEGAGWRRVHLPTHAKHFYDIERVELEPGAATTLTTDGSPQVLTVVEGGPVQLRAGSYVSGDATDGEPDRLSAAARCHFAETYVVPAAAETFELTNEGQAPAKVLVAFMKPVAG